MCDTRIDMMHRQTTAVTYRKNSLVLRDQVCQGREIQLPS